MTNNIKLFNNNNVEKISCLYLFIIISLNTIYKLTTQQYIFLEKLIYKKAIVINHIVRNKYGKLYDLFQIKGEFVYSMLPYGNIF